MSEWKRVAEIFPPQDEAVFTKIDDADGVRNEQKLKLHNNLWWVPSGEMYVYYTPTHWRHP